MTGMNLLQEQVFWEIHSDNPREGPGSFESTRKAYSMLQGLPAVPQIMDVGCGPGKQTFDLAMLCNGIIHAVDFYQPFLDRLQEKAKRLSLSDRIHVHRCDMNLLPFEPGAFNLIWAEGSIYIIGFEKGLRDWKLYLKPGGYIAATEISWLQDNPPEELVDFWRLNYPAMQDIVGNLSIIEKAGYKVAGFFTLPESDWWEDYYDHIEVKIRELEIKYAHDETALKVLDIEQQEIDLFRKYCSYYGYVFYVVQSQ